MLIIKFSLIFFLKEDNKLSIKLSMQNELVRKFICCKYICYEIKKYKFIFIIIFFNIIDYLFREIF